MGFFTYYKQREEQRRQKELNNTIDELQRVRTERAALEERIKLKDELDAERKKLNELKQRDSLLGKIRRMVE